MESSLTSLHMYIWYGRLPTRFWLMHPNWDWLFTIYNDNHMCQWTHNKSQKIDLIDILSIVFYPPLLHTWCWMTCLGSMEPDLDLLFCIYTCIPKPRDYVKGLPTLLHGLRFKLWGRYTQSLSSQHVDQKQTTLWWVFIPQTSWTIL